MCMYLHVCSHIIRNTVLKDLIICNVNQFKCIYSRKIQCYSRKARTRLKLKLDRIGVLAIYKK